MAKLKYEDIIKEVEDSGWHLLSATYVNLKTDMSFQCPNGHTNFLSLERWRRHQECPICKNNPFSNVKTQPVKKTGYRILALDQASITSGWSVFDGEKLVSYGHWSSEGTHSTERIGQTKYWAASMIAKWKPDMVILEDIQLQKYTGSPDGGDMVVTFKKLAHLQGVLKNYLFEIGIPYKVVSPSTWRSHSNIKGKQRTDRKKNAQLKVKSLYDINVDNDTADAILIGRWAANEQNQTQMITF